MKWKVEIERWGNEGGGRWENGKIGRGRGRRGKAGGLRGRWKGGRESR